MIELMNITDEAMRNYHYLWYTYINRQNFTLFCRIYNNCDEEILKFILAEENWHFNDDLWTHIFQLCISCKAPLAGSRSFLAGSLAYYASEIAPFLPLWLLGDHHGQLPWKIPSILLWKNPIGERCWTFERWFSSASVKLLLFYDDDLEDDDDDNDYNGRRMAACVCVCLPA